MGGWVGKEEEKRGKNRPKMLRRGKEGCRKGGKRRGRGEEDTDKRQMRDRLHCGKLYGLQ